MDVSSTSLNDSNGLFILIDQDETYQTRSDQNNYQNYANQMEAGMVISDDVEDISNINMSLNIEEPRHKAAANMQKISLNIGNMSNMMRANSSGTETEDAVEMHMIDTDDESGRIQNVPMSPDTGVGASAAHQLPSDVFKIETTHSTTSNNINNININNNNSSMKRLHMDAAHTPKIRKQQRSTDAEHYLTTPNAAGISSNISHAQAASRSGSGGSGGIAGDSTIEHSMTGEVFFAHSGGVGFASDVNFYDENNANAYASGNYYHFNRQQTESFFDGMGIVHGDSMLSHDLIANYPNQNDMIINNDANNNSNNNNNNNSNKQHSRRPAMFVTSSNQPSAKFSNMNVNHNESQWFGIEASVNKTLSNIRNKMKEKLFNNNSSNGIHTPNNTDASGLSQHMALSMRNEVANTKTLDSNNNNNNNTTNTTTTDDEAAVAVIVANVDDTNAAASGVAVNSNENGNETDYYHANENGTMRSLIIDEYGQTIHTFNEYGSDGDEASIYEYEESGVYIYQKPFLLESGMIMTGHGDEEAGVGVAVGTGISTGTTGLEQIDAGGVEYTHTPHTMMALARYNQNNLEESETEFSRTKTRTQVLRIGDGGMRMQHREYSYTTPSVHPHSRGRLLVKKVSMKQGHAKHLSAILGLDEIEAAGSATETETEEITNNKENGNKSNNTDEKKEKLLNNNDAAEKKKENEEELEKIKKEKEKKRKEELEAANLERRERLRGMTMEEVKNVGDKFIIGWNNVVYYRKLFVIIGMILLILYRCIIDCFVYFICVYVRFVLFNNNNNKRLGVAIGRYLISAYFVGLSAMKLVAFRKQRLAMNKLKNNDANNANSNQSLLSLVMSNVCKKNNNNNKNEEKKDSNEQKSETNGNTEEKELKK